MPPPAKVLADAEVRLMVPVPVTVRFVEVAVHGFIALAIDHVPEPKERVLTKALEPASTPPADIVTLYVAASNVPAIEYIAVDDPRFVTNASCSVIDPEGLFI